MADGVSKDLPSAGRSAEYLFMIAVNIICFEIFLYVLLEASTFWSELEFLFSHWLFLDGLTMS